MQGHNVTGKTEAEFARRLIKKLPSTLRVGAFDFKIEIWASTSAAANNRFGEFSAVEQTIRISEDIATRHKVAHTFIHEALHAAYWVYGVDDGDKEERIVSALSVGIVALFRDNPWLPGWIESARL